MAKPGSCPNIFSSDNHFIMIGRYMGIVIHGEKHFESKDEGNQRADAAKLLKEFPQILFGTDLGLVELNQNI